MFYDGLKGLTVVKIGEQISDRRLDVKLLQ